MNESAGSSTSSEAGGGPTWMGEPGASPVTGQSGTGGGDLQEIKGRIHRQLLDRLNLANIETLAR
jgi:hypothetical protein